jgi:hypothetical protein
MSVHDGVDREAFQTLLANAFAVQVSGLDTQSLAALCEIQRFIAGDEFELHQAMQMIVERAGGVSNASGVAIGLLEAGKNELVYRAGNGRAAKDVGLRVPAVLSVSSNREMRREILRVENAGNDNRVEAEIARQFGAMSLLMLPIYKRDALVGVLQVLFDEAHSFSDREVRTYRLMVGTLEDAMLRELQPVPKQTPVCAVEQVSEVQEYSQRRPRTLAAAAGVSAVVGASRRYISKALSSSGRGRFPRAETGEQLKYEVTVRRKVTALWRALKREIDKVVARPWSEYLRNPEAAIAAAIVLSLGIWISHRSYIAETRAELSRATSADAQLQSAKPTLGDDEVKRINDGSKDVSRLLHGFRRVRVGPNEVDYIADDVTIRTFESRPAITPVRNHGKEIKFGDDVTVRYFATSSSLGSQPSSTPATMSSSPRSR